MSLESRPVIGGLGQPMGRFVASDPYGNGTIVNEHGYPVLGVSRTGVVTDHHGLIVGQLKNFQLPKAPWLPIEIDDLSSNSND